MTAERRTATALVGAQVMLLVPIVWAPGPAPFDLAPSVRWIGWGAAGAGLTVSAIAALGLGRGLTPMPIPNGHAVLRTGGLYRFVRHPIYTALLVWAIGLCLTGPAWSRLAATVLLCALFAFKARFEERQLRLHFEGYDDYAARTPRFVPRMAVRTVRHRP